MNELRLWVVGFGTVGRWLVGALDSQRATLAAKYEVAPKVVGVANARDGFVYDAGGLDTQTLLGLVAGGRAITEHPGAHSWESSLEGLAATEADLLVEVSSSPRDDGEPGLAHMREALGRSIPVVTSNKWPVALHGVELAELARTHGVAFRAESTVMSGTPVLGPLVDGLAGTTPIRLRGVLNATANFVLTVMEGGKSYAQALAAARTAGLAERDASADVEGYDSVAKTMVLAGLVFGVQLRLESVVRRGIAGIDRSEISDALSVNARIRLVSTVEVPNRRDPGSLEARVEPRVLPGDDLLSRIAGATNAVVLETEPVGEVAVMGPGAGLTLAGQGVLSDVIGVARERVRTTARSSEP